VTDEAKASASAGRICELPHETIAEKDACEAARMAAGSSSGVKDGPHANCLREPCEKCIWSDMRKHYLDVLTRFTVDRLTPDQRERLLNELLDLRDRQIVLFKQRLDFADEVAAARIWENAELVAKSKAWEESAQNATASEQRFRQRVGDFLVSCFIEPDEV